MFVAVYDHPCTVHVEVYVNDYHTEQCIAQFSLDLVSPVEYLFRKYSLDNNSWLILLTCIAIIVMYMHNYT